MTVEVIPRRCRCHAGRRWRPAAPESGPSRSGRGQDRGALAILTEKARRLSARRDRGTGSGMSESMVGWWVLVGFGAVTWSACCGWMVYDWHRQRRRAEERQAILGDHGCRGCRGEGAHLRWCVAVVGREASYLGVLSQDAEMLADHVGTREPYAASACYLAALLLRDRAIVLSHEFKTQGVWSSNGLPGRAGGQRSQLAGRNIARTIQFRGRSRW
jgi:hypothetical protein